MLLYCLRYKTDTESKNSKVSKASHGKICFIKMCNVY